MAFPILARVAEVLLRCRFIGMSGGVRYKRTGIPGA